jgi:hypothetical protein
MSLFASNQLPLTTRQCALAGGLIAGLAAAAAPIPAAVAEPPGKDAIPHLADYNFGWQTNVADWQEPPPGLGHGPIRPDPAHPFMSNAEAGRRGLQPTLRIGDAKDPILKPWAAQFMQASNEEALTGTRQVPFAAQARCYPGGVPGQLLFPFEPVYFIQTPKEVWMMWQRDHMVRRVFLTGKHSKNLTPSWFGESIGHYENGDTLVVDTIGLSTKNSYIDNFRTPHTEKEHVVERFKRVSENRLEYTVTVEDPTTWTRPWTAMEPLEKQSDKENQIYEADCHEGNYGLMDMLANTRAAEKLFKEGKGPNPRTMDIATGGFSLIGAISSVQDAFAEDGTPLDPSYEKRAAVFIAEVVWFTEAIASQKAKQQG